MTAPLLHTEGLTKSFKKRVVVRDLSVALNPGEVVGLLGPNGAGKTTTFGMIVGLLKPDSGHILFQDMDITPMPMFRRARAGIAYLPQEPSVFQHLTVRQNLQAILEYQSLNRAERNRRIDGVLEDLNITGGSELHGPLAV
ncbi:MAG TPA: ATP-binding cassette domain-containing protein, partial [Candidatus Hydrogenedentes bacterium]|nr:ATP-binding cassette domain-containing protein [Candidatus Hydrogenedentota bacterium]